MHRSLYAVAANCTDLEALTLGGYNEHVTDGGITVLLESCKHLHTVRLSSKLLKVGACLLGRLSNAVKTAMPDEAQASWQACNREQLFCKCHWDHMYLSILSMSCNGLLVLPAVVALDQELRAAGPWGEARYVLAAHVTASHRHSSTANHASTAGSTSQDPLRFVCAFAHEWG